MRHLEKNSPLFSPSGSPVASEIGEESSRQLQLIVIWRLFASVGSSLEHIPALHRLQEALRDAISVSRTPFLALRAPFLRLSAPFGKLSTPWLALRTPYGALSTPFSALRASSLALSTPYGALSAPFPALSTPHGALRAPFIALRASIRALRTSLTGSIARSAALRASPCSVRMHPLSAGAALRPRACPGAEDRSAASSRPSQRNRTGC